MKRYKCQKKWHIKQDCLEWKRDKDKNKEGSSRSANEVEVDANSNGDLCFVSSNLTV